MSNLKKVAEKAKVSPITVSRVINSPEMVSKKTIEKSKKGNGGIQLFNQSGGAGTCGKSYECN